jgi:hypothetical protein
LKATEQPIDTGVAGKCFLDMLGVFAGFETNLRRERQLEGIAPGKNIAWQIFSPTRCQPTRTRRHATLSGLVYHCSRSERFSLGELRQAE